jgi:hypothetical protein
VEKSLKRRRPRRAATEGRTRFTRGGACLADVTDAFELDPYEAVREGDDGNLARLTEFTAMRGTGQMPRLESRDGDDYKQESERHQLRPAE